jgi:hypothetical protein
VSKFGDLPTFETTLAPAKYKVRWSSSGAPGTPVTYDVRYQEARYYATKFGDWRVILSKTQLTNGTIATSLGKTVCFEARAHSNGFSSPWSAPSCTSTPIDDPALSKSPRRAWGNRPGEGNAGGNDSRCYNNTFVASATKGSELSIEATFKHLAVVVAKVPGSGTIEVLVNGQKIKDISLGASTTTCNVLIPVRTFSVAAKRDVELKVLRPGRVGVYLDGLGTSLI